MPPLEHASQVGASNKASDDMLAQILSAVSALIIKVQNLENDRATTRNSVEPEDQRQRRREYTLATLSPGRERTTSPEYEGKKSKSSKIIDPRVYIIKDNMTYIK